MKLLALNAQDYGNIGAWCGGHPSAVAHRSVARQLVAAVQKYFPDWTVANPVSLSVDQVGTLLHPSQPPFSRCNKHERLPLLFFKSCKFIVCYS